MTVSCFCHNVLCGRAASAAPHYIDETAEKARIIKSGCPVCGKTLVAPNPLPLFVRRAIQHLITAVKATSTSTDYHQLRADAEGISRADAKIRNFTELYGADFRFLPFTPKEDRVKQKFYVVGAQESFEARQGFDTLAEAAKAAAAKVESSGGDVFIFQKIRVAKRKKMPIIVEKV